MFQYEFLTVQGDPGWKLEAAAVLPVAQDGESGLGELDPNLMFTAGDRLHLQPRPIVRGGAPRVIAVRTWWSLRTLQEQMIIAMAQGDGFGHPAGPALGAAMSGSERAAAGNSEI